MPDSDEEIIVYPDDDIENADWIKTFSWGLPTDKDEFLQAIGGPEMLDHFMTLPAARPMPESLKKELGLA